MRWKGDVRIGNFLFHTEKDSVTVFDINRCVSHTVSTMTPKGQFVAMALEQKQDEWLKAYATVVFNVLSCVPDMDYLDAINHAAVECADRHKELYGIKEDIGKDEDDKITESQKEYHKAMEEMKDEG